VVVVGVEVQIPPPQNFNLHPNNPITILFQYIDKNDYIIEQNSKKLESGFNVSSRGCNNTEIRKFSTFPIFLNGLNGMSSTRV
jgi:hypothetical protein